MGVTVQRDITGSIMGGANFCAGKLVFDAEPYPEGGIPLAPSALGMTRCYDFRISGGADNHFVYDHATGMLHVYGPPPPEEEVLPPPGATLTLTSLEPSTAAVGTNVTLHVHGTGFTDKSAVYWDGAPGPVTTYVSATELTAPISIGAADPARSVSITVYDEGTISNALPFTVALAGGTALSRGRQTPPPPPPRSAPKAEAREGEAPVYAPKVWPADETPVGSVLSGFTDVRFTAIGP